MTKDDKQTETGTQNWLRTATLALTILTPVINNMASRLADRLEQGGGRRVAGVGVQEVDAEDLPDMLEDGDAQTVDVQEVDVEDLPDFLQGKVATRSSLSDSLQELKDHPYTQQLRKRGESLTEELQDLVERGSQLSQSLLARGSDVTSDLVERGNKASQDLIKRSGEARKELRRRGKKLNKQLNKRSQKLAKELRKRSDKVAKQLRKRNREVTRRNAGQSGLFWTIAGFSVGLTAAGVAAYILIRQRIQQQQQLEEAQSIQVPQNGYANAATSTTTPSSQGAGFTRAATQPEAIIQAQPALLEDTMPAIAVQGNSAAAAAAFVGIVETRHYYPVATQLDQLSESSKTDIVYFISEDEAKAKGYTSGV